MSTSIRLTSISLNAVQSLPIYEPIVEFLEYDIAKYPFAAVLSAELDVLDLGRLHEKVQTELEAFGESRQLDSRDNQAQREKLSAMRPESNFYKILYPFLCNVLKPRFSGPMSYTSPPVFRVHMPKTPSVSAWHRDAQVTGRDDQITLWMPFVDTYESNTIWVEKTYGTRDFAPISVRHGQAILLDTGFLEHGSVANLTDTTRVSIDLRLSAPKGKREPIIQKILANRPPGFKVDLQP